jgi:hydrogenase nickel incorporation protein HypB
MFQEASVMIINKIDLLPYVSFDLAKARKDALALNPKLKIIEVSCRTGEGLADWVGWLEERIEGYRAAVSSSRSGS